MKILAIVTARMTSTRLPGKVLLKVKGKPLLQFLIERLKAVKIINQIVIAATTNKTDDVLERFATKMRVKCFRGSEDDVMGRVLSAAERFQADIIVDVTGDCPIIDCDLVDQAIQVYLHNKKVDYVNNNNIRSYPDGMDVQVFSYKILKKSYKMTTKSLEKEHITLHIRNNPKIFNTINIIAPKYLNWPELGLTLDEKADYNFLKKIIEHFYNKNPLFTCYDIINFLKSNKNLVKINSYVLRKGDN
jgi:spore coat polysaccharide biosynthesis protein SpsF